MAFHGDLQRRHTLGDTKPIRLALGRGASPSRGAPQHAPLGKAREVTWGQRQFRKHPHSAGQLRPNSTLSSPRNQDPA